MDNSGCRPENNPLLVCDPEPLGWARQDPCPYFEYVSMEELITQNNLRLAEYRERLQFTLGNITFIDTILRTTAQAREDTKVAFLKADLVRNVTGEATSPRKGKTISTFAQRRSEQGQRNRAAFFRSKEPDFKECLRDCWLQQDGASWQESLNKALPSVPAENGHSNGPSSGTLERKPSTEISPSNNKAKSPFRHQRSSTTLSEPNVGIIRDAEDNGYYSPPWLPRSKSQGLENTRANADYWNNTYLPTSSYFSTFGGPPAYYQQPIATYQGPNQQDTITVFYQHEENNFVDDETSSDVDSDFQFESNTLGSEQDTYFSSTNTNAYGSPLAPNAILEEECDSVMSRSSSVPGNMTTMTQWQKARLESYRQSRIANETPKMDKVPYHVVLARSRTLGQLSPSRMNDGKFSQDRDTPKTDNDSPNQIQKAHISQETTKSASSASLSSPTKTKTPLSLRPTRQDSLPTTQGKKAAITSDGVNCKVERHITPEKHLAMSQPKPAVTVNTISSLDGSDQSSKVSVGAKAATEIETNPLALQRDTGPPIKKMFGDGGWLGNIEEDKKPILKSFWDAVKVKVHKAKPKIDLKDLFAVRSQDQDPTPGMVPSKFMISCNQEFQSMLYARLDLLVCTVANKFLMTEYTANRMTMIMASRFIERWVALGRAQFTEFNCGQPFQALIIWECREILQFHGDYDARIRDGALDTWQKNANSMAVLTRCNGDSAIQKHLHDSWKILEMLGGTWYDFDSLSKLHISFHEKVALAKERNDARGIPHDWNPPPVPETPKQPPMQTPDMMHQMAHE